MIYIPLDLYAGFSKSTTKTKTGMLDLFFQKNEAFAFCCM